MALNFTENTPANGTSSSDGWDDHTVVISVLIFSVLYIILMAIAIAIVNGVALYAIYKDHLKCFRTPLTTLITGIVAADFITGIAWPLSIFAMFTGHPWIQLVGMLLPHIAMNFSFMMVLALAIAQLLALGYTAKYERYVTRRSATYAIVFIFLYCVFLSPQVVNFSWAWYVIMSMIGNTAFVTIALIVIYIKTYFVFKKALKKQAMMNAADDDEDEDAIGRKPANEAAERSFVKGTFILTLVLIVTALPTAITLFIWIFKSDRSHPEFAALIICNCILFAKFLLDPFVFMWRMPKYRSAMKLAWAQCCCGCCSCCVNQAQLVAKYDVTDNNRMDMTVA